MRNAAPAITDFSIDPASINIGGTVALSGAFTDPGSSDTHQVRIQWGDGSDDTILDLIGDSGVHRFAPVRR